MKKLLLFIIIAVISCHAGIAQVSDPNQVAKDAATNQANNDMNNAANNGVNSAENSVKGLFKKKNKDDTQNNSKTSGQNPATAKQSRDTIAPVEAVKEYRNYDFVPGDKIIFQSQLDDEHSGEIPSQFTLNTGQMDIQTQEGQNVIRVPEGSGANFKPRMKTADYLPDQFTIEFDAKNERFGTAHMTIQFGDKEDKIQELHFGDGGGIDWTTGSVDYPSSLDAGTSDAMHWHHIAIAINKNQGKVYVDQYRVANVNNLAGKATEVFFDINGYETSFYKNIRIAAGGIDIYKKITTGSKIIMHGILFDLDKATLKPESMGSVNQIYDLMQKDASLKFEIDGYTDNTGNAAHNLTLSQQRADAVKAQLVSMGIAASRLSAKGFGDASPIAPNDTPEGKANNRRVEFVKM
jgi:outer membrane protein OmpA-like peptidoglycan-associated protein